MFQQFICAYFIEIIGIFFVFTSECFATGSVQVKLRAWNAFSSLEVDVDTFDICGKDSAVKLNGQNDHLLRQVKCFLQFYI